LPFRNSRTDTQTAHHLRSYGLSQLAAISLATHDLAAEGWRSLLEISFNGDYLVISFVPSEHAIFLLSGEAGTSVHSIDPALDLEELLDRSFPSPWITFSHLYVELSNALVQLVGLILS
jgi:hypothetical protein